MLIEFNGPWWLRNGIMSLRQECQSQLSACATVQEQPQGVQNKSLRSNPTFHFLFSSWQNLSHKEWMTSGVVMVIPKCINIVNFYL
jgi:hypothetical protein